MKTPTDTAGYVLVDSCVFCSDIQGTGTSSAVFVEGIERLNFTLLVPDIVRDEVINKYSQILAATLSKYKSCVSELCRHVGFWPKIEFPEIDVTAIEQRYTKQFPYSIEAPHMRPLPYPETAHKDIAVRAIAKKKPFKETGAGYRDALICETIKHFLLSNPSVTISFITMNHHDFLKDGRLHQDIVEDFASSGIADTRIAIFQNLGEFNTTHLLPKLHVLNELLEDFKSGQEKRFNVRKWILSDLTTLLRDDDWVDIITGVDFVHSYVSKCDEPLTLAYDDVRQLPSGDILLSFSAALHIEVSVSFDGDDYDRDYAAMCELVGEPDGPVGDCTTWVPIETHIAVSLVLDKDTLSVKSSQVDNIEGLGGYCEAQPHPSR